MPRPQRRDRRHLPGSTAWLVCEQRTPDERRYYLTNHPEGTPLAVLAADIKARWVCEQGHQQMKEELGLDHLECRNWMALRLHTVLTMIALCFLQHVRLRGKKVRRQIGTELFQTLMRCPCCNTLIPDLPKYLE